MKPSICWPHWNKKLDHVMRFHLSNNLSLYQILTETTNKELAVAEGERMIQELSRRQQEDAEIALRTSGGYRQMYVNTSNILRREQQRIEQCVETIRNGGHPPSVMYKNNDETRTVTWQEWIKMCHM